VTQTANSVVAKKDLRNRLRALRREFVDRNPQTAARAAQTAAHRLLDLLQSLEMLRPRTCIACFWSVRDEISTQPLIERLADARVSLALPATPPRPAPLVFRQWSPTARLVEAAYGLKEPDPAAPLCIPDVIITPLLAFDRTGHRLGYGGGYYDRTFSALAGTKSVLAIGFAYAIQEVAAIPAGPDDKVLSHIVTEIECIACR